MITLTILFLGLIYIPFGVEPEEQNENIEYPGFDY
jgi:hypothetical protein